VPTFRNIVGEFLQVSVTGGVHAITDVSERFASKSAAADRLAGIMLEGRFPQPPELQWTAVVKSLPLSTVAVQFHHAFVASDDPAPISFVMAGREAVTP